MDKLLRRRDVEKVVGLSRSTIYAQMAKGRFPSPVRLTDSGRAVGWRESDIEQWQAGRTAA